MVTRTSLFDDYVRFHRVEIANRDVDPVYPVLRKIGDICDWDAEERVRSVFLHVAYYDLGSALAAVDSPDPFPFPFLTAFSAPREGLRCGTERRRHRMGDNLAVHLHDLDMIARENNGLLRWLEDGLSGDDPVESWQNTTEALMQVKGNGRWAAYKTCEMLAAVAGLPLAAPDMGHANSSGPRAGLGLLYPETRSLRGNRTEVITELNQVSDLLVRELRARGVEASLATAETTLCDFHSLVEGRYYPGLDIDVMLEQLLAAPLSGEMLETALRARRLELPEAYLGERAEFRWRGADRVRKQLYRKTGEIVERG